MTKKTTFNLDQAISRISKPSVFDRIVKEIEATEIPAIYIESILIQYYDGNVVELSGKEISHPIPLNKNIVWDTMAESFKKMRDVRIFLNTALLEEAVNIKVEELLGKYC